MKGSISASAIMRLLNSLKSKPWIATILLISRTTLNTIHGWHPDLTLWYEISNRLEWTPFETPSRDKLRLT
jgi:hypothetical protein